MTVKPKRVSVLIVKDTGTSNISFGITIRLLKFSLFIFALFFISLCLFVVYFGKISSHILFVKTLEKENRILKKKAESTERLYAEIERIKAFEKKIKILALNYTGEEKIPKKGREANSIEESILAEKDLDEFVQNIKLQRNLNFIGIRDSLKRRRRIFEALPSMLPVDGWISRRFHKPKDAWRRGHSGIDIAAAYNSPIKAAGPGIITYVGWKKGFGNFTEVDHGYGFVSRYGHCSRLLKKKGDLVQRSQTIAFVGSSGRSSGPHLHFEVAKNGKEIDPLIFILK